MEDLMIILYLYVFPTLSIIFPALLIILWLLLPDPAKRLLKGRIGNRTMSLIATDDHKLHLRATRVHPEGFLETMEKKPQFFGLARTVGEASDSKANQGIEHMEDHTLKPTILDGYGKPVYFAYAGKTIAVNGDMLITLHHSSREVYVGIKGAERNGTPAKIQTNKEGDQVIHAVNPGTIHYAKVLLPLMPTLIKKYFKLMWNQSQLKALQRNWEEIGYRKGKREFKEFAIPLIIIGVVIIAGAVVLAFA